MKIALALGDIAGAAPEALLALSLAAGMAVMQATFEAETRQVAGPKRKHNPDRVAVRHAAEKGSVTLGWRRVSVNRPRAQPVDGHEVPADSHVHFAAEDMLTQVVMERMLAGVAHQAPRPHQRADRRGNGHAEVHVELGGFAPVRAIMASLYELGLAGFVLSWELILLGVTSVRGTGLGCDRRPEDSEAELTGSSVSVRNASSVAAPESNSIVGSSLWFNASQAFGLIPIEFVGGSLCSDRAAFGLSGANLLGCSAF